MSGDGGNGHCWATEGALHAVASDVRRLREDQESTRKRVSAEHLDVHTLKEQVGDLRQYTALRFDLAAKDRDDDRALFIAKFDRMSRLLELLARAHGVEVPE